MDSFLEPDAESGNMVLIDWGDGRTGTVCVYGGGTLLVVGSHVYTQPGTWQVSGSLQDGEGPQHLGNAPEDRP